MPEQRLHRKCDPESLGQQPDQPQRRHRVAALGEEVVTAIHRVVAEHLRPHPRHGTLSTLGTPIKVDGALETPLAPPARLGEHTDGVLGDLLKYPAERIAALRREGVIR